MKVPKSSIKKWQAHCKKVQEMTLVNAFESDQDKEKRIEKAKQDYEFFVEYYFPHYAKSKCATFQLEAAQKVSENKKLRAVFEWFRAGAKSTHFSLMLPLWLKIKNELNVMILVGKSEDNAITLLGDVQAELQFNERYRNDFGEQINIGSWEEGRFVTKDDKAFFALGRGQSPRGLRGKNGCRPDYIVCDDIDCDEIVTNENRVNRLVDWVLSALFGCMAMGEGRFIIVGNRISKNSVLARMSEVPGILHSKVNALNENGEPTWKEKYSVEEINEVINTIGSRRAQQEYFNNPVTDGAVFKLKNINYTNMDVLTNYKYVVCYTDPSFKSGSKADYKATVLTGRNAKGEYHVIKSYVEQTTVSNMVQWHYDINRTYGEIPIFYYMEANFIQDILFQEFYAEGEKVGFQIPILPDKRAKPDKFQRIESLQPLFERGLVFFNEVEKDNPGMKRLIEQLLMTEKGCRFPDDASDALEGGIWILINKTNIQYPIILGKRNEGKYRNEMRY